MVYLGKPSTGCATCRKRRVKCDETVPNCSNCLKRQVKCPGYRSLFDASWRPQNEAAERSVQRQKNAVDRANREKGGIELISQSPFGPQSHVTYLPQDFQGYALNFFLPSYIVLPNDTGIGRGFLQSVYPVWLQSDIDSPLRPAVIAVASCMLEAWSLIKPDQPASLSRMQYQKAVAALEGSLRDGQDVGDDILMSSLMLDFYEGIASFCRSESNQSPHVNGIKALIERRRQLPVVAKTSQTFLLATRTYLLERALRNREFIPFGTSTLDDLIHDLPVTTELMLDDLNIEVANFQASALFFAQEIAPDLIAFHELINQARELDQRLLMWYSTIPADWKPIRVSGMECIPQSVMDAGVYQNYCDVHKNVLVANKLNIYNQSRIRIQMIVLNSCRAVQGHGVDADSISATQQIQISADDICASVPFHLGDRNKAARFDDRAVRYPHTEGQVTPKNHYTEAAAFSGFNLTARLVDLLAPELPLRPSQRGWIGQQLGRLKRIYAI